MIFIYDGKRRRRSSSKCYSAKYKCRINRNICNQKHNQKSSGDNQKCSDRLYKGNADDLFAGACDFLKYDLPTDHYTGKTLKELNSRLIPQGICDVQCNNSREIRSENNSRDQPSKNRRNLHLRHHFPAGSSDAYNCDNTKQTNYHSKSISLSIM